MTYDLIVGADTVVTPSYDPNCANGKVSGWCEPVAIISADLVRDPIVGKNETATIAEVLSKEEGMGMFVIDESAW